MFKFKQTTRKISVMVILMMVIAMLQQGMFNSQKEVYAASTVKIGDYVQFGRYMDAPILWRVINLEEDGTPMLYAERILCLKPFDAVESGTFDEKTTVANRQTYGSNKWENSNLREWLNSNASAGNVKYTTQPPTEAAGWGDNAYADEAGFLNSFSEAEINAIKTVTRKSLLADIDKSEKEGGTQWQQYNANIADCVTNYDKVYYKNLNEKVYLLDVKELHDYVYNRGWEYKKIPTKEAVFNSDYHCGDFKDFKYWNSWLRLPYTNSYYVRLINTDGDVGLHVACYSRGGVVPALNLTSGAFTSGKGTVAEPYVIGDNTPTSVAVTGITLNKVVTTLQKAQTEQLTATVTPSNATNNGINWSVTSGNNIASVSTTGLVTAVTTGSAIVRATSVADSTKYAECTVTVKNDDAGTKDNKIVDSTKVWTVKFTHELVLNDANKQNITVKDSKGNVITTTLSLDADGKSVVIKPPVGGYIKGQDYFLNIGNNLKNKNGRKIKSATVMKFSIKSDVIPPITENSHSKNEIIEKWKQYKPSFNVSIFDEQPSTTAPYKIGKLNIGFINEGLNMTNFVRYLAGLPDDVINDETAADNAQHGAVLLSKEYSHTPSKPTDMDDDFYEIGYASTSGSNIGVGYVSIADSIQSGYMPDEDDTNIDKVGHRRWLLNPPLKKVAFGFVGSSNKSYTNVQVFDRSRKEKLNYEYVAWPNKGDFPTSFFSGSDPWSISLNTDKYKAPDINKVSVTVKRTLDGKTWTLDKTCNSKSESGNYFNINNGGYGISNCIIFRPDNISKYKQGDEYSVTINGIQTISGENVKISYSVNFFILTE
jgi:Bacterial surface proteins containing Ig-like domains